MRRGGRQNKEVPVEADSRLGIEMVVVFVVLGTLWKRCGQACGQASGSGR